MIQHFFAFLCLRLPSRRAFPSLYAIDWLNLLFEQEITKSLRHDLTALSCALFFVLVLRLNFLCGHLFFCRRSNEFCFSGKIRSFRVSVFRFFWESSLYLQNERTKTPIQTMTNHLLTKAPNNNSTSATFSSIVHAVA